MNGTIISSSSGSAEALCGGSDSFPIRQNDFRSAVSAFFSLPRRYEAKKIDLRRRAKTKSPEILKTPPSIPEGLKAYGIKDSDWASAMTRYPPLFNQKPERLLVIFEANLKWLEGYDITKTDWASAAIRHPALFWQKPETLRAHFDGNLEWLKAYGISGKIWASCLSRQPTLFSLKPETLQENFEANLKWLKDHDLTAANWALSTIKSPQLLYQKPETLRANFEANLEGLKKYGVIGKSWGLAATKFSQLYYQKPKTLQANFETNLEWLKKYNVSGQKWASAAIKSPQLFYQKPETLRTNFELLMVVSESIAVATRAKGLSFREARIARVLSWPTFLSWAEDNLLLRLAFAEIVKPKPASRSLTLPRSKIEKDLVESFGFDGDNKALSLGGNLGLKEDEEQQTANLHAYAEMLRTDWRSKPAPTEPRKPSKPVVSVFLPPRKQMTRAKRGALLIRRMIMGGLIKGYALTPSV